MGLVGTKRCVGSQAGSPQLQSPALCMPNAPLAGREHLLFYARIKNLRGRRLRRAVDDALRSVNLFAVGDELAGGYRCELWGRVLGLGGGRCWGTREGGIARHAHTM